ncbi:hypothetical protein LCGC14_0412500 [marine sediment metagenome]|uniref:Uncharacterized protein n=1 Tax=marine sediment metagenome TaxID=412755 RepID=A0A0F9SZC0_9ZZZZ
MGELNNLPDWLSHGIYHYRWGVGAPSFVVSAVLTGYHTGGVRRRLPGAGLGYHYAVSVAGDDMT